MEDKSAKVFVLIRILRLHRQLYWDLPLTYGFVLLSVIHPILCGTGMPTNSFSSNSGTVDLQRFSRSHFAFSLDLYSVLADQIPITNTDGENANLLFSPYTISTALSMIFLGAEAGSSTSVQLRSALHLNNFSFSAVHDSYKAVLSKLADPYYSEIIATVNSIFQSDGKFISEKYKRALEEFYHVQIQRMDHMRHQQLLASENLDSWARNDTAQKLSYLLQMSAAQKSNSYDLGITLANGLAFRSDWLFRFNPASTFDKGLFYTTSKKRFEIPMMVGRFKIPVGYSSDLECRIAELPFSSRRVSFFIILPDDVDRGIPKLEANMSSDNIKALFSTLKDETVNIRLPRFRLEPETIELSEALAAMGINDIFNKDRANLTGISYEKIRVNRFVHKTILEVEEGGYAEPTASGLSLSQFGSFGEKYFEVDHPFLFLLWDYHSGIILFIGRITNPDPWIN